MANKRPDGDGLVRKRSDGRWEGRIVVGHKEDGKPIYRSVFAKTQKELMEKLHRSIETFRDVELKENSNLTLGEWLDKWLDERIRFTVRESTLDGYRRIANNYIKPHLGDKKIGSVTTADVQKMYNWLRENGRINEHYERGNSLSDSSVRGIHMMLHQAMDAAVQERIIVKNPTDGTVIPKANYAPKNILTEAQLQKFLDVVREDPVWSDFFYTELTTGMRRGEICGLKWQDFDEKTGRLQIRRAVTSKKGGGVKVGETKTEKGTRSIQLPPSTVEILKARKKKSYSEWIFHNPTVPELPLSPETAYRRMKTLLRYYELFLLELGTGLRLGEILALQWDDLNMETGELRITKSATFIKGELHITEPKTKSSIRVIVLPGSLLEILDNYKAAVNSRWMFPSPVKEDCPLTPNFVRRRMQQTLERAQCKKVRFHDLRHTFATMALEHGMDVKTLSTIIGHISSATTLDIYSHVTDTMQKQAAVKIDHQIGKTDAPMPPDEQKQHTDQSGFQPYKSKYRKAGTGGVYQLNDHLWEGKYSPRGAHGKRISRNVYAKTREECEEKLAAMIEEVKKEIAAEKEKIRQ